MIKHPKPVGRDSLGEGKEPRERSRSPPRKAIIYVNMWAPRVKGRSRYLWTYHNEEKIYFEDSPDARAWASKHGFDGIKLVTQEDER